ncbi:MAG TPA: family 78 glycoside hydrolase catalytic domain [Fimbriimonas sp.]|nr:family 78 glycoside hydrolase catalytic domain [Fimbriimonas sp.]
MIGALLALAWQQTVSIWAPKGVADDPDTHVAFRGKFSSDGSPLEMKILGASEYLVWLDGKLVHDGPARFAHGFAEYQSVKLTAPEGSHVLAVHVRNNGVTSRILTQMKPFLWCSISDGGGQEQIQWKCARIPGYRSGAARISNILGWTDWLDTRQTWPDWQQPSFNDSDWLLPTTTTPPSGIEINQVKTGEVQLNLLQLKSIAKGEMITTYGYENDDPTVRFFLNDLNPKDVPPQGIWRRYDLGRVRLGRPKLTLDLPAGTVIEMAMSESLQHGRVQPWITLSGSRSANMDHFIARGGVQEFFPLTPKGGRYVEVHILHPKAKFVKEEFLERTYFQAKRGSFESDDPLLNNIWNIGVETVRACSEDALVDNPTRERGQWTGDVASVASEIVAAAFGDMRLSRRALMQAAQDARDDGLVAGVGPGDPGYLSTYAAQWVTACVRYWEVTGDKSLLSDLLLSARRNIAAFEAKRTKDGVSDDLGWGFVDWGYVRNPGPSDMSLNLHYLVALRAMARWERAVNGMPTKPEQAAKELQTTIETWLNNQLGPERDWSKVGYHRGALALSAGLVPPQDIKPCIDVIKRHILSCYPNDPNAPRLSDPGVAEQRIHTPYFCHFSFAALLDQGEVDFVLGQYKKCWGWAINKGLTTWPEVFDLRWSHCHEWSGAPTWQLTKYVLGIRPRFDLGPNNFEFEPLPSKLKRASGTYPLPNGGELKLSWKQEGKNLKATFQSSTPVKVKIGGTTHTIQGRMDFEIR